MRSDLQLETHPPQERRIFCNRTLNLRAVKAIGYDMDYTLVHYRVEPWERRAYESRQGELEDLGWPVGDLQFDPDLVIRGLVIDTELGNLVKANRFGYVKRASHGTATLDFETHRQVYARTLVDLSDNRCVFLNTLFSLSEGCLYAQLVDLLDEGRLPAVLGYADLYRQVRRCIDEAHMEGRAEGRDRRRPRALRGAGPRDGARAARPARGGQEAAAHHQLRVGLHQPHDDLRLRPLPARRHRPGATSSTWSSSRRASRTSSPSACPSSRW